MIGKIVSHYKITRELGAGGMGVVYEAVDTKLDRTVALKFLPPESTRDPDAKARFVHEAKAASAIDHPNVCNIYEIDETEDGHLFLAMACYEGETLKDRIERGPLPLDDALDITRQVAEGLTEAHARDIVHRDIKPANIFITNGGVVKILDFGLAKLAGLTQLTQEGTTLGTAHYMSPEQAGGQDVDHRSDLWCLGVCLYEMITGQVPFQGDHAQAVTYAILNSDPEPVTGLRTGVPLELERIIVKCLAKDPAERYQHAGDLLADLTHLDKQTTQGATETMVPSAGHRPGSRRWPWIMGSVLALVLAVAYGIQFVGNDTESDPSQVPMLAVLPFENLGDPEDEYFSDGITEEIIVRLTSVDGLRVLAQNSTKGYKNTEKSIVRIGEELEVDYILEGTIRWHKLGGGVSSIRIAPKLLKANEGTHVWADTYLQEMSDLSNIFNIQTNIATNVAQAMGVELLPGARSTLSKVPTRSEEAYQLYLRGLEFDRSWTNLDMAERAIRFYEAATAIDTDFSQPWGNLGRLYSWLVFSGRMERDQLPRAKAAADHALSLDRELYEAHIGLGYYYYHGLQDYEPALECFEHAAAIDPGRPFAYLAKGAIARRMGMYELSRLEFQKGLKLDPGNPSAMVSLAQVGYYLRDFKTQRHFGEKLVEMWPDNPEHYLVLIDALVSLDGELAGAERILDASLNKFSIWDVIEVSEDISLARSFFARAPISISEILKIRPGPDWSEIELAELEYMKGQIIRGQGNSIEAGTSFLQIIELLEPKILSNPEIYHFYPLLAGSYTGLGRHEEAVELCRSGLANDKIARDNMSSTRLRYELAVALVAAGKHDEAMVIMEELLRCPSTLNLGRLKTDPAWDPLRDHPRFQKMIADNP